MSAVPSPPIVRSPGRLSGAAVFAGTRVPVQTLIDYLEGGEPLDAFLSDFPDVSREHAVAVLELARVALDAQAAAAQPRLVDAAGGVAGARRRRVVIDHCVPRQLVRALAGDPPDLDVTRVGALGLAHLDDGPLLDQLAGRCEVFVTVDKRLPAQQRLDARPFGTVLLRAHANTPSVLGPLVPRARRAVAQVGPGPLVVVTAA